MDPKHREPREADRELVEADEKDAEKQEVIDGLLGHGWGNEHIATKFCRGERPAGRAQRLANFGRRGIGRIPRKCKLRGPCGVTPRYPVHFAGA